MIDDENLDVIVKSIRDSGFKLLAISDCVEHTDHLKSSQFSQNPTQSKLQSNSQKVFTSIINNVDGYLCHIDLAEMQLLTFQKKQKKAMPWNATLTIGSKFKILISAYVKVVEEKFVSSFKTESTEENTMTKMVTEYTKNNEPIAQPDVEDIIKAYMYGSTMVVINEDLSYKGSEQCLSCLGFTKSANVRSELLAGEGCHIVLPRKEREKSAILFFALVVAMVKNDMVMIARKVYRKGLSPITVVLLPKIDDDKPHLTMIQLPFANDMSMLSFPRLRIKKNTPTDEQEQAIKKLVDAMDLMNAVDDDSGLSEAFALETTLNPVNQHLCRSVSYRALHPSDPLPLMDPELIATLDVPSKVKERNTVVLKEVEKLFPLEIIERKLKKVFGQSNKKDAQSASDVDMEDEDLSTNGSDSNIVAIGTVSPVEDFTYLLKKGERFVKLAEQMQTVIYDLIFRTAAIQLEKILQCIMFYREQAKIFGPFSYNNWIKELKNVIVQKNRLEFWQNSIVKEGFGLITEQEALLSPVTVEEQKVFYEIATKESIHSTSIPMDEDDDLDALLD